MPRLLRQVAWRTLSLYGFLAASAGEASAQFGEPQPPVPRWEARLEATAAETLGAAAGIGLGIRTGWYARPSLTLAAGAVQGADEVWRGSQRGDLVLRFLLDPFGERPRGWYGGAGVSVQHVAGRSRGSLLLLAGVEGRTRRGVRPALELGLGNGVRIGIVFRSARPDSR